MSLFPFWVPDIPRANFDEAFLRGFLSALPPLPRASTLCQLYHDEVSWRTDLISVEELESDIFGPLYDQPGSSAPGMPLALNVRAYRLATMFIIFAISVEFEEPSMPDSPNYCQLALAVLAQSSLIEEPTVEAIQTLVGRGMGIHVAGADHVHQVLMNIYWSYAKPSNRSLNQLWMLNGLAMKLAESVSSVSRVRHVPY
jgi:hypothetical protein